MKILSYVVAYSTIFLTSLFYGYFIFGRIIDKIKDWKIGYQLLVHILSMLLLVALNVRIVNYILSIVR